MRAIDVWLIEVPVVGAGGFVIPCVPVACTPAANVCAETEAIRPKTTLEYKTSMIVRRVGRKGKLLRIRSVREDGSKREKNVGTLSEGSQANFNTTTALWSCHMPGYF